MDSVVPVRRRLEMPFLLLCGMGLSAFFAGVGTLAYLGLTIGSLFSEAFTFNGQSVGRDEFWRHMWPFFVAYPVLLAAFGTVAFALWKERLWSREAIMAWWALAAVAEIIVLIVTPEKVPVGTILMSLIWLAGCWGVAAWYLYGKANVQAYYAAVLQQGSRS
jgi:hypothetical protein